LFERKSGLLRRDLDEQNIFLKIGSHLGDVDIDPNTPKSHGSIFSNEEVVNSSILRRVGSKKRI
jgi:hypothetical protein